MKVRIAIATLALAAAAGAAALAGPPLICHPVAIGNARSLPWHEGRSWNGMVSTYDTSRLVADTIAALDGQPLLNIRMETLRRAAIYASRDASLGQTLLNRLYARALSGRSMDPAALYDAGYFAEAVREAREILSASSSESPR